MKLKITKIKIRRILFVIILFTVLFWLLKQYQSFIKIKSADQLNSRVSKLIPQINQLTVNFFDGKDILQNKVNILSCENLKSCISIKNKNKIWLSPANSDVAIPIDGPYLVKIVFKNQVGTSGINFIGKFPDQGNEWWDGLIQLSVYMDYDKLKISLNDGYREKSYDLLNLTVVTDNYGFFHLYLLFDLNGKNITLFDNTGEILKNIDIQKSSQNSLSDGIFPFGNLYIGLSIAPNSSLDIAEFLGFNAASY